MDKYAEINIDLLISFIERDKVLFMKVDGKLHF